MFIIVWTETILFFRYDFQNWYILNIGLQLNQIFINCYKWTGKKVWTLYLFIVFRSNRTELKGKHSVNMDISPIQHSSKHNAFNDHYNQKIFQRLEKPLGAAETCTRFMPKCPFPLNLMRSLSVKKQKKI